MLAAHTSGADDVISTETLYERHNQGQRTRTMWNVYVVSTQTLLGGNQSSSTDGGALLSNHTTNVHEENVSKEAAV